MSAIAAAASSSVVSLLVAKRCGRRVWSITPTDHPSLSSQIVRQDLPSTFMRFGVWIRDLLAPPYRRLRLRTTWMRAPVRLPPLRRSRTLPTPEEAAHARSGLRSRVQQPGTGAGASADFCPLDARGLGLPRAHRRGEARRARPLLRQQRAPDHRSVPWRQRRRGPARALHPRRLLARALA